MVITFVFLIYNKSGGRERIRTAVGGFADLCLATRPLDPVFQSGCKNSNYILGSNYLFKNLLISEQKMPAEIATFNDSAPPIRGIVTG
jgi:hypothetical protein